jgi:transcription antitermination factor NusG
VHSARNINIDSRDSVVSSTWYALYTKHQHEKIVAQMLTTKGFETFLPLYQTARRWKDRTKLLSLPLFPCYVLLKGGLERRLDILTTPGIHALVSYAGEPAAIPAADIEAIRRAVESGSSVEPHPLLKCGDTVRVKSGPLQGIQGILVRKKNSYRLVLSVEMLGKAAAVEIDVFLVERLSGKPSTLCGIGCEPWPAKRESVSYTSEAVPSRYCCDKERQ